MREPASFSNPIGPKHSYSFKQQSQGSGSSSDGSGNCAVNTATCHRCGGTGHYARVCPSANPSESYASGSGYSGGDYSTTQNYEYGGSGNGSQSYGGSGSASGSHNQGNRACRNSQSPRTQGGHNSGAERQVYGCFNAMTQQEVEQDPPILIDSGAIFSFVSPSLAWNINSQPTLLGFDMLVQMAHKDLFCAQCEYRDCPVIVEGELMETNLIPFQLAGFDVILGIWTGCSGIMLMSIVGRSL
ncbi:hypothetical protein D8674_041071 [Pyrus ussuriensis x Pyrus communis]|uniref:CCHC-type domain-containing protein n=1 Tax=Pyrus ussuriensis x Pyrus communis TaxID=2448454 RepID=A0A5N5HE96_9ROSA|nr:hypothetical protein D8674_041071 [Pyrus ussuriensis x Pyrus communis]